MNNKEIIALSDFEHVLERSTMYVGSLEPSEEYVPIIIDEKIVTINKNVSVGFYKLMNEILDNAFDEAKRLKGKMKNISIEFNSKTSEVIVKDNGDGFHNGTSINSKTNLNNIETAMTILRAGSNFKNENSDDALIGTNGVGASVVNMLSDSFSIETINDKDFYLQNWNQFKTDIQTIRKKKSKEKTGTVISFIPRKDKFKNLKWDKEYIQTLMTFKNFLKNRDSAISNIKFEVLFDGTKLNIDKPFFQNDYVHHVDFKFGYLLLFPHWWTSRINTDRKNNGTAKISFVNSALCTGSHERIIKDWVNEMFNYSQSNKFLDYFFVLDLPPKFVRFGDQNKTKFATGRWEIEPLLDKHLKKRFKNSFKKTSPLYKLTRERIDDFTKVENLKALKAQKRRSKNRHQISDKYFAPSGKKGSLFIVEGACIDDNEKINIWRNGELCNLSLRDVKIGDSVLTHKHRFKEILNTQRKLKEVITIKTKDFEIKCSKEHRFYIFDKKEKTFKFVKAINLNLTNHQLVKNKLGDFIGTTEISEIETIDENKYKIRIYLETGEVYDNSLSHKYCIYNIDGSFEMKESKDLKKNDLIATFTK